MKRFSMLVIIKELQIKNKMRYHFITIRMAIIRDQEVGVGQGVEEREPLYNLGRGQGKFLQSL